MDKIRKELTTEEPELIKDKDSRSVIRAVVDILKKGFKEQVHPVSWDFKIDSWELMAKCKVITVK